MYGKKGKKGGSYHVMPNGEVMAGATHPTKKSPKAAIAVAKAAARKKTGKGKY